MSTREKIVNLIDEFSEDQLDEIFTMLFSIRKMLDEEAADDAFCRKMVEDYEKDNDPEKHDSCSLEDFAKELGIELE